MEKTQKCDTKAGKDTNFMQNEEEFYGRVTLFGAKLVGFRWISRKKSKVSA
jgi:hypothetical protein